MNQFTDMIDMNQNKMIYLNYEVNNDINQKSENNKYEKNFKLNVIIPKIPQVDSNDDGSWRRIPNLELKKV